MASPIVIEIPPKPKSAELLSDEQWKQTWRYACVHAQARMPLMHAVKRWWKSRTVLFFAAVSASCTALTLFVGDVKEAFGEYGAIAVVILVGGGTFLRKITSTGLSK